LSAFDFYHQWSGSGSGSIQVKAKELGVVGAAAVAKIVGPAVVGAVTVAAPVKCYGLDIQDTGAVTFAAVRLTVWHLVTL
jgi:hypothetical protein